MAAAGVALLSSAGSGGLGQWAPGLIQEQGRPASPGRAPGHAVPRIPRPTLGPSGGFRYEDNRMPSSIEAKQEGPLWGWTVPGRPQKSGGAGWCLGSGSRLAASARNTSGVSLLDKDRSEPALGTAVSWRVGRGSASGQRAPPLPEPRDMAREWPSAHVTCSPLPCPAGSSSWQLPVDPCSAGQGLPAGCGPAWFLQLLPRAPAPPNRVTMALGDGISAVTPPSADWGEGDSGFRSSSKGEPGQCRGFYKHLPPS